MKNKRILLFISIIVFAIFYYFAIYRSINGSIDSSIQTLDEIEKKIETADCQLKEINEKEKQLDSFDHNSCVYEYDSLSEEMNFLSEVFDSIDEYNISLNDPTSSDDIFVKRKAEISFVSDNYNVAKEKLYKLFKSPYRIIIHDFSIIPEAKKIGNCTIKSLSADCKVTVKIQLTFIELCKDIENTSGIIKIKE